MTLKPNFLTNAAEIVAICEANPDKFKPREDEDSHAGALPFRSRFSTWKDTDMPQSLIEMIFAGGDWDPSLPEFFFFIQIQRYLPGEYIVPHRDNYSITDLHLVTLTGNPGDALIVQTGPDQIVRVPDLAGQLIVADFNLWHWVDPVLATRYSLVVTE